MRRVARALHPAESRGYRELYVFARQLADHWRTVASRLGGGSKSTAPFERGSIAARELLSELEPLTARYGLHGRPAAQGAGANIARQRTGLRDRFLERGQAARLAVGEAQRLTILLAYLSRVADARGDAELADFCGRWERKLGPHESAARKAAAELGADPDAAIEPLDSTALGRTGQKVGFLLGAAGEWLDRRAAARGVTRA